MNTTPTFYIAILAGGLSSRMGCDKRFLKYNKELLVDRAVRLGTEIVDGDLNRVLLCGEVPGRKCFSDVTPRIGPLGGVLTAFLCVKELVRTSDSSSHSYGWLFVLPVDMPLLKRDLFEALSSELKRVLALDAHAPEFSAIGFQDYEMPFLVQCSDRTRDILERLCKETDSSLRSIHSFLAQVGILRIKNHEALHSCMLNVNSPRDLSGTNAEKREEHRESQI